jgi:hypothetical protein
MPRNMQPVYDVSRERLWSIIEYEPHRRQWEFHNSKARFRVPASGRRFGKSQMVGSDALLDMFYKARTWIIADTYSNGEDEFVVMDDGIQKICQRFGTKVKSRAYNVKSGDMHIELPWGALLEVKSARYPNTITGKGVKRVIMAEAAKIEPFIWEKHARPALSDWRGRADFPSTPEGNNWYKHDAYDYGQPDGKRATGIRTRLEQGAPWEDSWESWNLPSWENHIIYPGGFEDPEIQAMKGTPEGTPYFWQEIGARFDVFVGQIYPQFDKEAHMLTPEMLVAA